MIDILKGYIGKEITVVMVGGNEFTGVVKYFVMDKVYCKEYVVIESVWVNEAFDELELPEEKSTTTYTLNCENVVGVYEEVVEKV